MQISGIGYNPYIYNTNQISANSLNPVSAISDDMSRSRVDYSGLLTEASGNENPLKPGQSANFADIVASQMSLAAYQRDRLFGIE